MKAKEREIRRKKRILDHAVESGNVAPVLSGTGSKPCACATLPRDPMNSSINDEQQVHIDLVIGKRHVSQRKNSTSSLLLFRLCRNRQPIWCSYSHLLVALQILRYLCTLNRIVSIFRHCSAMRVPTPLKNRYGGC